MYTYRYRDMEMEIEIEIEIDIEIERSAREVRCTGCILAARGSWPE